MQKHLYIYLKISEPNCQSSHLGQASRKLEDPQLLNMQNAKEYPKRSVKHALMEHAIVSIYATYSIHPVVKFVKY